MKKICDIVSCGISVVMGIIVVIWYVGLPATTPVHLDLTLHADRYGSKFVWLILLVFPFIGFVPFSPKIKEIHSNDPEEIAVLEKKNKHAKKRAGIYHVILVAVYTVIVSAIMIAVNRQC